MRLSTMVCVGGLVLLPSLLRSQLLPGGHVAVVTGEMVQTAPEQETRLRRPHTVRMLILGKDQASFSVRCLPVGTYSDPLAYRVQSVAGNVITEGKVPRGESAEVTLPYTEPGVVTIYLDAGSNAMSLRSNQRYVVYEASESAPLKMIYHAPRLHFWVPPNATKVNATVGGGGKQEAAAFQVFAADGSLMGAGNSRMNKGQAVLDASPDTVNQAWSIVFSKLDDVTFEDFSLVIGGDAVPFVAESAERLALPTMHTYARIKDGAVQFGVQVNADAKVLEGHTLTLTVKDGTSGSTIYSETVTPVTPGWVGHELTPEGFLKVTVEARLVDEKNQLQLASTESLATAHGQLFEEIPNLELHDTVPPSALDQQRGYMVFARGEPGDVRPNSHPREAEITNVVETMAAPGEYETLYFALFPLQDTESAAVQIGQFRNSTGKELTGAPTDLRWVKCWPQRTDWRSATFHTVPELLERRTTSSLHAKTPQQLAFIVQVPDNATPGTYDAQVSVSLNGIVSDALKLRLTVLPFKLRTPPGIVWGLYPDTARWKSFPTEQIEREMRDFMAHGINALMMYPQWDAEWTMHNGVLNADFTTFRERIQLYRKVGLGGPMVASIQSGEHIVKEAIKEQTGTRNDDPEDVYRQFLTLLKNESVTGDWPEFCLHSVDEPHGGEKLADALRTLRTIKSLGFKTFNTCYGKAVRDTLDPYLDFRCYNNIGFLSFPNADAAKNLREETLAAGDTFWWYGTGCYTNRNFIQDGNVIANRFMGGFHFWRTGATGCWAWTFLRAKGDVYDDFDGGNQREHKEACIAYPTPDGKGLIPTLQWEGIREGVDDYKYLYTLTELIREARASGVTERIAYADQAASQLDRLLTEMPWTCREGAFTNADATLTRNRIVQLCATLLSN